MNDGLNVLLVVLEGARLDRSSAMGAERETTPFLDQLSREGVRFPHAYSTAGSSVAALASMFTGLFASLHGANEESPGLGPAPRLLPELLKAHGYRTAAFCPDPIIGPQRGFGRGFDRFFTAPDGGRITGRAADYARRASDRVLGRRDAGARRTTHALLDWIGTAAQPFFAFVRYREALRPLQPPAPYDRSFMPAGLTPAHARLANHAADGGPRAVGDEERAALAALHDGALRYADLRLKEIADALAARGRWEQTLCIVTAGFGEDLGDDGTVGGPAPLRDSALHVPLILRCPGRIPSGFVVEEFAQPVDLLPTIAALTGCALDAPVQGRALFGGGGASAGPAAVMAEAFRDPTHGATVRRKVIRTRREKLIWRSDEDNALYDLTRDPHERCNLVAEQPARADRLRRALFDWFAESQRWATANGLTIADGAKGIALERQGASE